MEIDGDEADRDAMEDDEMLLKEAKETEAGPDDRGETKRRDQRRGRGEATEKRWREQRRKSGGERRRSGEERRRTNRERTNRERNRIGRRGKEKERRRTKQQVRGGGRSGR